MTISDCGFLISAISLAIFCLQSQVAALDAFRRDPGHPQWHHSAFHDVKEDIRFDVRRMLHSRAQVPFQVPLDVNIVLIGFNGDGGYRYSLDANKLEDFMKSNFPTHRPACLETGEPIDIEHHLFYKTYPAGQPELITLEKVMKEAMVPAGAARESEYGREVPLYEVDAAVVEPTFQKLYDFIFDTDHGAYSAAEMDRPVPTAIFLVNFDKVRMDPSNNETNLENFMYGKISELTSEELKKQEGGYIYRYRYHGGGASQVWLGSSRFVVIDLSAGPCTYGKIETEEGSVSYRTIPRLRNLLLPRGHDAVSAASTQDAFLGQLAALISITIEHVIAPDVRFETVDLATRLLIPIIVLQNHNRYNILEGGHNYSIDMLAIEREVKKMVHSGQEVVIIGGSHALHLHEKLAIAVSKSLRGHSIQETKNDGRFHVRTRTYLDGAILKEEMERSADVLAAGLLDVSDPTLSSKFFLRQHWMDETDDGQDSIIKHRPLWATHSPTYAKEKKMARKKQGNLYRTYGTRVIPVFVLSLAGMDVDLLMEDESLVWASKDVVIVLQHDGDKIPLRKWNVQLMYWLLVYLMFLILHSQASFSFASYYLLAFIVNHALAALSIYNFESYCFQHWMDETDDGQEDSIIKHRPLWATHSPTYAKEKKMARKKQGNLYRTYGTRVIPVFVLSLAGMDVDLLMEDESLVWASKDVVIVLQHDGDKIPLSYVSETERRHAVPSLAQRHILAGLASTVGGLSAPYEKASHVHERPVLNWLWATGCHPFGPFSNASQISILLQDIALRNTIYARVDTALRRIRDTSEIVQSFAAEHLKTPLGEPIKGGKKKSSTELWLEKFIKKTTNLPEPFPHELVERLEHYLDSLEEQLVDLSSLLYDHRLLDAHLNSSEIFQSTLFTQQYVERVLATEKQKMKCCNTEYRAPVQSSQAFIYGGILIAGFVVYFLVIFFSSPER
ncbi:hypothetical protein AMTR_s00003p00101050 [Amborella trichopoda]|uniref:DUF7906 domain-containing protein n=2 Tax=Amborella trichopoda TaxID=13333 RepID=W1P5D7_AMBTC|nr:hypothetical protein AMTR_s00003p00101050 [Amborella trichopoda]